MLAYSFNRNKYHQLTTLLLTVDLFSKLLLKINFSLDKINGVFTAGPRLSRSIALSPIHQYCSPCVSKDFVDAKRHAKLSYDFRILILLAFSFKTRYTFTSVHQEDTKLLRLLTLNC